MSDERQIPAQLLAQARTQAAQLMEEIPGVQAVVLATEDGFDVASVARAGLDSARIAAMASSIAAISAVVAQEARLGQGRSVTIDTEAGFSVVFTVRRPDTCLVLSIIATQDVLIGEVMYRASHLARFLSEL